MTEASTTTRRQALSFFAKANNKYGYNTPETTKKAKTKFDEKFARHQGVEIAGIGKVRRFEDYREYLNEKGNSKEAVNDVQADLSLTTKMVCDFIDNIATIATWENFNVKDAVDEVGEIPVREESPESVLFKTTDGYYFSKGKNEAGKTWYQLKAPQLELYRYWTQSKPNRRGVPDGGWTVNSLVHTIDLKDPSQANSPRPANGIKYQIGNMGNDPNTKFLLWNETNSLEDPRLDVVQLDHDYRSYKDFHLMHSSFYKE